MLAEAAAEEAAAAAAMGVRRVGAVEDLRCLDEDLDREASAAASRWASLITAQIMIDSLVLMHCCSVCHVAKGLVKDSTAKSPCACPM